MKTEEKMHQLCVHLSKHWTKQEHYEMERKLIFWKIDKNILVIFLKKHASGTGNCLVELDKPKGAPIL